MGENTFKIVMQIEKSHPYPTNRMCSLCENYTVKGIYHILMQSPAFEILRANMCSELNGICLDITDQLSGTTERVPYWLFGGTIHCREYAKLQDNCW